MPSASTRASIAAQRRKYRRREPEHKALYALLQEHLAENVIPAGPMRQWVLTLPHGLRYHAPPITPARALSLDFDAA